MSYWHEDTDDTKDAFRNVVNEAADILFRPQYKKEYAMVIKCLQDKTSPGLNIQVQSEVIHFLQCELRTHPFLYKLDSRCRNDEVTWM